MWVIDPTIRASTIELDLRSHTKALAYLRDTHSIDLESFRSPSGHRLSYRAVDRLLWTAVLALGERTSPRNAMLRVASALRDDAKFFAIHPEIEPEP
jgi:hypothetical protein